MPDGASAVNPFALDGRAYLVTGASSGIGRATAIVLAGLGARVALSGRRAAALEETRSVLCDPDRHLVAPFDLTQIDGVATWVREVRGGMGQPLDGFVHSAGLGGTSPIRTLTRKSMDEILVPNLYASLALVRGVSARGVIADAGGSLVLLSSAAALVGTKGLTVYAGSKGALHAFVKSAAQELADKRIRVNCVAPGYVETPMLIQAQTELPGQFEHLAKQFLGVIPPEDVGLACAYLLSAAARHVTGTVLVIDSGYSL